MKAMIASIGAVVLAAALSGCFLGPTYSVTRYEDSMCQNHRSLAPRAYVDNNTSLPGELFIGEFKVEVVCPDGSYLNTVAPGATATIGNMYVRTVKLCVAANMCVTKDLFGQYWVNPGPLMISAAYQNPGFSPAYQELAVRFIDSDFEGAFGDAYRAKVLERKNMAKTSFKGEEDKNATVSGVRDADSGSRGDSCKRAVCKKR